MFVETQRAQLPNGCSYKGKCQLKFGPLPVCVVTPCGSGLQKKAGNKLNFSLSGKNRNCLETQDALGAA